MPSRHAPIFLFTRILGSKKGGTLFVFPLSHITVQIGGFIFFVGWWWFWEVWELEVTLSHFESL